MYNEPEKVKLDENEQIEIFKLHNRYILRYPKGVSKWLAKIIFIFEGNCYRISFGN